MKAIDTVKIKQKLKEIEKVLPEQDEFTCSFCKFLGERLNQRLNSAGFLIEFERSLLDAQKGVDGYTGKPLSGAIAGYPPVMYNMLRLLLPTIVDAVCPAWFAEEIKEHQQKVLDSIAGKS